MLALSPTSPLAPALVAAEKKILPNQALRAEAVARGYCVFIYKCEFVEELPQDAP